MKLKQINPTLFKLFIPYDELEDRGVNCQVLTSHSVETHSFFYHIIHEVLEECGNLVTGYFQMDVYSYPCYGIYMILKRDAYDLNEDFEEEEEDIEGCLSVNIMKQDQIIYEFAEFDDVVQACRMIKTSWNLKGILYFWRSKYYLEIKEEALINQATLMSILLEFGEFSTLSKEYLAEYGNRICKENIITIIKKHFLS
jgi:adapter protein MecA 1/2